MPHTKVVKLVECCTVLTRESMANLVSRWLTEHIDNLPEGGQLLVNCDGIKMMNSQCAEIAFGSILLRLARGDWGERSLSFYLENTNPEVEESLNAVLLQHNLGTVGVAPDSFGQAL